MHILMEKMHRQVDGSRKAPVPPSQRFAEVVEASSKASSRVTRRRNLKRIDEAEWQSHVVARNAKKADVPSTKKRKQTGKPTAEGVAAQAVKAARTSVRAIMCPRCRLDTKEWGFCGVTGEAHGDGARAVPPA